MGPSFEGARKIAQLAAKYKHKMKGLDSQEIPAPDHNP